MQVQEWASSSHLRRLSHAPSERRPARGLWVGSSAISGRVDGTALIMQIDYDRSWLGEVIATTHFGRLPVEDASTSRSFHRKPQVPCDSAADELHDELELLMGPDRDSDDWEGTLSEMWAGHRIQANAYVAPSSDGSFVSLEAAINATNAADGSSRRRRSDACLASASGAQAMQRDSGGNDTALAAAQSIDALEQALAEAALLPSADPVGGSVPTASTPEVCVPTPSYTSADAQPRATSSIGAALSWQELAGKAIGVREPRGWSPDECTLFELQLDAACTVDAVLVITHTTWHESCMELYTRVVLP